MIQRLSFLVVFFAACAFPQAVSYQNVSSTTDSACSAGALCNIKAIPGATVNVCSGAGLGIVSTAGTVVTLLSGPSFTGASGSIQIAGNTYQIQTVVSSSILVLTTSPGTQASAAYSTLTGCLAAPVTTYTDPSAGTSCPPTAQLTPVLGGACISTTDNQGTLNFWALPGQYYYYLTIPATAGGGAFGPYPISIGTSAGCPLGVFCDANYPTLGAAFAGAGSATLYITREWSPPLSPIYDSPSVFLGNGKIQAASGQKIKFNIEPNCPVLQHCYDTSAGGSFQLAGLAIAPVTPQNFGAVCNDVTDSTNPAYHDDQPAIEASQAFFPPDWYMGAVNPQGVPLLAGTVIIPITANSSVGNTTAGACVIGEPINQWSPGVKLQGAGTGNTSLIITKDNYAPLKAGTTQETITNVTGGNGSPIHITATTIGFAVGDSVVIQEVDLGYKGCYQVNSWAGGADPTTGWIIAGTNFSGSGFDLANSSGVPACTYISGGKVWDGIEVPIFSPVNTHGTSGDPINNFNIVVENVIFEAGATGNQMTSGIFCNCSVGSLFKGVTVISKYRLLNAPLAMDNVTFDQLTLYGQDTSPGGPDTQSITLVGASSTRMHALTFNNLKTGGTPGTNFNFATPAISIIGQPAGIVFLAPHFERVEWPIMIQLFGGQGVHFDAAVASTDDQSAPCILPLTSYPQVAMVVSSPSGGSAILGTDLRITGSFGCYGTGVAEFNGVPILNQRGPASTSDISQYPMNYDSNFPLTMLSSYMPGANSSNGVTPVIYGSGDGRTAAPAMYFGPGFSFYNRTDSPVSGYGCWPIFEGSGGGPSQPEFNISSFNTCADLFAGMPADHQFLRISNSGTGSCPGAYRICLDPTGTEGTGFGGNTYTVGQAFIGTTEKNVLLYSAAGTALPACNGGSNGTRTVVSDATTPTFLGTYTSGGAVESPVICNGTNWVTY